ncbi:MAG: response regulator transcription factor [Polyangiaceae bacterium]
MTHLEPTAPPPSILVVEDDAPIADAVLYALRRDGMQAKWVTTLAAAAPIIGEVDLAVLDLTLPDGSGFSLLDAIRRLGKGPRVIVLTARDEDVDCVAALEAGADDYVTKPFSPRALVARIRAVLRRGNSPSATGPAASPSPVIVVDAERRIAHYAGTALALTRIEFDLLAALAETPGRVRSRAQLVDQVWGQAYALTERTVDSHFKALRRKLEDAGADPSMIETVRGVGFKLREST